MHERIAEIAWTRLRSVADDTRAVNALERIAACGFDTVLVSDLDDHGAAEHVAIRTIVDASPTASLAIWLVVSPDRDGAPLFNAHVAPPVKPWLVDSEAALDPRRAPSSVRPGSVQDVDSAAWQRKLEAAVTTGVSGFVCRDADRVPLALWSTLTKALPDTRWVAWTPGLGADCIEGLAAHGFDTVCSSLAWWDGRSRWLTEELHRAPDARTLAFPVDPFDIEDPSPLSLAARLKLSAFLGDALLVPQALWTEPSTGAQITAANQRLAARHAGGTVRRSGVRIVSSAASAVTVLVSGDAPDLRGSARAQVVLLNPDATRSATLDASLVTTSLGGFGRFDEVLGDEDVIALSIDPRRTVTLEAGSARLFDAARLPAVLRPVPTNRRSTDAALKMPRLAIEAITPSVDAGRFPAKRTVGEAVRVEADILIDGHEMLGASLLYRALGDREWSQARMVPVGNDRFAADFPLARVGLHEFTIEAWRDVFASFRYEIDKKAAAGLDVTLELIEGKALVDDALVHAKTIRRPAVVRRLTALARSLAVKPVDAADRAAQVALLLGSQTLADMQASDRREFAYRPDTVYPVDAERSGVGFASWYELFPRSLGNAPGTEATHHGTFDDVIARLPAVKAMGFDVLYFPPIHPIGKRNRKGRNNSLTALDDDPGSPYAIGSPDGGHDALHPELGTFDDFRRLRDAALEHGLELALDFAIQCSPDHPWLQDHPGWFAWRPDGSLRYAENPPKKYEDIVNVEFYGHGTGGDAAPALWIALRDVILLWVEQGVRIFRVDNPHTKPLPFWEWMIGEVRAKYPDTIFLAEAFTRPKVMYRLAKVGFSQSYTYFTWRNTKQEFIDYITELTGPHSSESLTSVPREFFRPHFFVNTPDINPVFLQRSGRAGFLIRAALASTLSGLWGVYSGFELCEATPVAGKEDYLDSEKYQLRAWDWQRPGNIIAEITALNRIRNENPALRTHLNTRFGVAHDPNILFFVKATSDLTNVLLIAINLDPFGVHEADFEIPLWQWGLSDDAAVDVTDLLDGHRFRWTGKYQRLRLDPASNPYAIWRVSL